MASLRAAGRQSQAEPAAATQGTAPGTAVCERARSVALNHRRQGVAVALEVDGTIGAARHGESHCIRGTPLAHQAGVARREKAREDRDGMVSACAVDIWVVAERALVQAALCRDDKPSRFVTEDASRNLALHALRICEDILVEKEVKLRARGVGRGEGAVARELLIAHSIVPGALE